MLFPAPESIPSITAPATTPGTSPAFRPGQVYQGRIVTVDGKLQLHVANQRISLPTQTRLTPGEPVQVAVSEGKDGLRLQISLPQNPPPASSQTSELGGLIANIAKALNLKTPGGQLQALLPGTLPQTPAAITAFLRTLLLPGSRTEDLVRLGTLLQQAVQAGAVPPELLAQYQSALAAHLPGGDTEPPKQPGRVGGRPEARLAAALRDGTLSETVAALRQELRSLVASLRGNEALRTYLAGQRLLKQFEGTTKRLTEQLSNEELPALRSLEHKPYGYLEIPLPQDSAFTRLQAHWLAHNDARSKQNKSTTLALDLETTHLGPLWILVQKDASQCRCSLRATDESSFKILDGARAELAAALGQAGIPGAHISVTKWTGDRVAALHEFFAPISGLDITG